jgi:hypothetical protein
MGIFFGLHRGFPPCIIPDRKITSDKTRPLAAIFRLFYVHQENNAGYGGEAMESIIVSYILPALGILILLICIGAFVFTYGERFRGKVQKIKAFGLDLEISVITFFVLVGVVFCLAGVYLQMRNYETSLAEARLERDKAMEALALSRKFELTAVINLENLDENDIPKLEDLRCTYCLYGDMSPRNVDVVKGYRASQFKVIFKDISAKSQIAQLTLEEISTGRRWIKENFMPLEPSYTLKDGS